MPCPVRRGAAAVPAGPGAAALTDAAGFAPHLSRWGLVPDGAPVATPGARLLPVLHRGEAAMLKVATAAEEIAGGRLLAWWAGDGSVRVLAMSGDALLMERARGPRNLAAMARAGDDDAATRVLCGAVARLHAPRPAPPPALIPLDRWFHALWPAAEARGGVLAGAAARARALLAAPRNVVPLHGDVHHGNVLDFGPGGWLAIDPKGLRGERGFDYANIFCNPDLAGPGPAVATRPERFARRVAIVADLSGIERRRLLAWIAAWAGLSAAWVLADGDDPATALRVAALALAALDA